MRTNTKIVTKQIKAHILEYFTVEELTEQVESMRWSKKSDYMIGVELVSGGLFLIYNQDMSDFLNGLGINPEGKEYSDQKTLDLYKHLVALQVEKLIEGN